MKPAAFKLPGRRLGCPTLGRCKQRHWTLANLVQPADRSYQGRIGQYPVPLKNFPIWTPYARSSGLDHAGSQPRFQILEFFEASRSDLDRFGLLQELAEGGRTHHGHSDPNESNAQRTRDRFARSINHRLAAQGYGSRRHKISIRSRLTLVDRSTAHYQCGRNVYSGAISSLLGYDGRNITHCRLIYSGADD